AVAHLAPEIGEQPIRLLEHRPEAVQARPHRRHVVAEDVLFLLQRNAHHVVKRQDRPHDEEGAKRRDADLLGAPCPQDPGTRSHSCSSPRRSWRMNKMTSGMSSGSAESTVAMPRGGSPISKALRMPSVASTCVESAGPPPEMKRTALKSPSAQIVLSSVHTR